MIKESDRQFEKRLFWGLLGFFLVAIGVSSYLHFFVPEFLRVPQETGLPEYLWPVPVLSEPGGYIFGFLCCYHCFRTRGLWQTMLVLFGSFLFTGILENILILSGRFGLVPPTYYFSNMGILWLGEVPVAVCTGWFIFAYSCIYIVEVLFGPKRRVWNALAGSALAVNIDLWMDPLASHPAMHSWTWLTENTFCIFTIPLSNFLGWFGLIFLLALLWDKSADWGRSQGYRRATWKFFLWIPILDIMLALLLYTSWRFLINPLLGGLNLDIMPLRIN
ncbi:MAG: carotenoid biosynthesis protein [bacterium]|nr:carotenoid biosynthesis protein [bacterium]